MLTGCLNGSILICKKAGFICTFHSGIDKRAACKRANSCSQPYTKLDPIHTADFFMVLMLHRRHQPSAASCSLTGSSRKKDQARIFGVKERWYRLSYEWDAELKAATSDERLHRSRVETWCKSPKRINELMFQILESREDCGNQSSRASPNGMPSANLYHPCTV